MFNRSLSRAYQWHESSGLTPPLFKIASSRPGSDVNKQTFMKQCFIFMALVSALIFFGCAKDGTPGLDGENGEQGIPGVDGTALLNGNGAPNNSWGKNGDFYLDKTTVSIYGPKTAAGWGEATSLTGSDGKDGIDGTNGKDGEDGKDGVNGANGKDGSKILSGNQIPTM